MGVVTKLYQTGARTACAGEKFTNLDVKYHLCSRLCVGIFNVICEHFTHKIHRFGATVASWLLAAGWLAAGCQIKKIGVKISSFV